MARTGRGGVQYLFFRSHRPEITSVATARMTAVVTRFLAAGAYSSSFCSACLTGTYGGSSGAFARRGRLADTSKVGSTCNSCWRLSQSTFIFYKYIKYTCWKRIFVALSSLRLTVFDCTQVLMTLFNYLVAIRMTPAAS